MVQIAHGWELDVDRGPDWLFVRPHCLASGTRHGDGGGHGDEDSPDLADEVWSLIEQNFARRLVLELDEIGPLDSYLIEQLLRLHKRICSRGWVMRICGLSRANQNALAQCHPAGRLSCYDSRTDAVMAARPSQPR